MIVDFGIVVYVGIGIELIELVKYLDGLVWVWVCLSDGEVIDVGVVIFVVGIWLCDELVRVVGLVIGDWGGVFIDLFCWISDFDIYVVGEVVVIDGWCYGLVGFGYISVEVVVD